jgi:hypothetical protein
MLSRSVVHIWGLRYPPNAYLTHFFRGSFLKRETVVVSCCTVDKHNYRHRNQSHIPGININIVGIYRYIYKLQLDVHLKCRCILVYNWRHKLRTKSHMPPHVPTSFSRAKAKRDAAPKHVGDGNFRSTYLDDGIFRHPHGVGMRHM